MPTAPTTNVTYLLYDGFEKLGNHLNCDGSVEYCNQKRENEKYRQKQNV